MQVDPSNCAFKNWLSKWIKKDSQSDFGVQMIKKLKKSKSGQRLDDKKR